MAISKLRALQQFVIREIFKDAPTGVMRTLPNQELVDMNVQILAQRLMQGGIDPTKLKNANQVENAINMIESRPPVQQGITSTKSAKVFNIAGEELDPSKPITGGTQPGKKINTDAFIRKAEAQETEAEMAARMRRENKEAIKRFKQKMKEDKDFSILDPEDMAQGGRAGFDNGGAPSITLGPKPGPMGPAFETDDPKEALKEIVKRLIRVEGAQIPISIKGRLGVAIPKLDTIGAGGLIDLLGGEVEFGGMKDFDTGDKKIGFKFRKKFDKGGMTRRTFLKILGGLASIPIIGKILKPVKIGKTVSKVPVIKTAPVEGKPEWFDSLVNKVIVEGDDVTKRFATGERQTIHQKTLDDGSVVRVTEDTDQGAVRVEYESSENVFGDPVQMEYKRPLPDEATPDPAAEFTTAESGPVGRSAGPEDYDIEIDEVGGTSIRDLDSDVSKLKEYATGKKPTIKEMMQNKRRKDKAARISEDSEAQTDAIIARQGDYTDDDFSPDFASGGIAGMLGE